MEQQNPQQDPHQTFIDPGPLVPSLLTLQEKHISTYVWNRSGDANPDDRVLNVRHAASWDHLNIPEEIHPYLQQAGFYHIARLRNHEIDHHLISALAERWRPETRTFHMSMGEVTITLEDVHHLLGLPTDGEVVSVRVGGHPFSQMVGDFLGVQPGRSRDLYKNQISLTFLRERYLNWHEWSGNEVDRM
ncbi:serine/threonine-protein phosphatase 7 long form homolog [Gastrolobium bilobum]|uniref:serine/threonine-protein phosphatase 7 long form homolog n=1 Tax=Gastrolobium bilobum TaxID=150636 RepID=UPI002AAF870F|nr:serine/threonine-protein phosphatase 7 long form homolog [Gastrolobium bilobum]